MSAYATQLQAMHEAMVRKQPENMLPLIKPARHNSFSSQTRLAVYADGYDIRLVDATIADYPALAHYMGEEECREAVAAFVSVMPSVYWDLNRYPVAFAAFLKGRAPDKAAHALADLESAITEVFWLPESKPLAPDALAGLSEEAFGNRTFRLRTAAKLLKLDYAANEYLTAYRANGSVCAPKKEIEHLLVIRAENEVQRIVLEPAEYRLLAAIGEGSTFSEALALVSEQSLEHKLTAYMTRWFQIGVFLHQGVVKGETII